MATPALQPRAFEECGLVLLSDWPAWLLVAGLVLAAAALFFSWRGYRRTKARRKRWILFALRTAAIATAVFIFLQPGQECRSVTRRQTAVIVAMDTSRSMAVKDESEATRLQKARDAVRKIASALGKRSASHRVELFSFDSAARPTSFGELDKLSSDGEVTRIEESLEGVLSRRSKEDLAGVVVVSDGADRGRLGERLRGLVDGAATPPAATRSLQNLGIPIHGAVTGKKDGLRDVAISGVRYDPLVFVHTAFEIDVEITVRGYQSLTLPVTLRRDRAVVTTEIVRTGPGRERHRVTFKLQPARIGKFLYSISVPEQQGEATVENNRRDLIIKVIRDKIRVLQVVGRPSWDVRFLRRLLKRNPNVDLISFFILRTPTDLALVPPSELSLIPFPTRELFTESINTFDLVIFQNFDFRPYAMRRYLPYVARYVLEHGGAFAMIGGDSSFGSGGYAGTVLEDVLPVRVPPANYPKIIDTSTFRPTLTPAGKRHPILRLVPGRETNLQAWKALPVLQGVNRVWGLQEGAIALAVHPRLRFKGQPMPVIATREAGKGRSMAVTTDTTWYWAFRNSANTTVRHPFQRFWNSAIRWLIRDPELELVRIVPDKERYGVKERVMVEVRALSRDHLPADGAELTLQVTPIRGGRGETLKGKASGGGRWRVDLGTLPAGPYRLVAKANLRGDDLGEANDVLLVSFPPEELEDPRADPDLLRRVAKATGGTVWPASEDPPSDLALRPPRIVRVDRKRATGYWDSAWVFVAAVLFLAAEWLLRRRWGFM